MKFIKIKPFRDCDIQLCFEDGSVYADFQNAKDQNGKRVLKLVRISYDGFGCCNASTKNCIMSVEDTARFNQLLGEVDNKVHMEEAGAILQRFFSRYKGVIWEDALERHGLLL